MSSPHIYRCHIGYAYTHHYVTVTLLATDLIEAKEKIISACLANYHYIVNQMNFTQFYDKNECDVLPLNFGDINVFTQWLINHIDRYGIEWLDDCSVEIT